MTVPLAVLAIGSVLVGLPGSPWMHFGFQHFLGGEHAAPEVFRLSIAAISTIAALVGLAVAWRLYLTRQPLLSPALRARLQWAYTAASQAYRFDQLYDRFLIQPTLRTAQRWSRFDLGVIDGAVNGVGLAGWLLAQVKGWFDTYVVDGVMNGIASMTRAAGSALRRVQTGYVQHYLLALVVAITTLVVWQLR